MAKITKIVKLQSAKFKTHQNGSNETSIFLSHSDCEALGLTQAGKVKFIVYKEDFILGLGMIMTLSTLPLYSKDVVTLTIEEYKKTLETIDNFFGNNEEADYEVNFFINTSQADRNYFNELKYNGLNIRHFLIENHSCLYFERLKNKFILRFKTFAEEVDEEEEKFDIKNLNLNFPIVDKDDFTKGLSDEQIFEKLISILSQDYDNPNNDKVSAIHLFAIKYAPVIIEKKFSANEIAKKSTISDSYFAEINKGLNIYKKLIANKNYSYSEKKPQTLTVNKSATPHTSPIQKIFYGVPGCGKSHKISEMLEDKSIFNITSEENQIVRTVFHPDYTNADFVGQILPEVKGDKIEYNFKEGPFTEILAKALLHPENQYVLIIEEINRGNSAAIFGEIFQLLDRIEDGVTSVVDGVNKFGQGWSEYFFMNDLINEYVRKMASPSDNVETSVQINGITFTENTGIRLPPNLSLLATMNTSDQNVFTLDNAFQRRWDMEYISNKYDESKANEKQKAQYNSKIGETAIYWGKFRDAINREISNPENSFANAEDKQLGLFFIKAENNVIKESDFSNKVLKYLWNDIFKRDKSIFNDDVSTFGDLLEAFRGDDAFINTFSSDFVSKIAE